MAGGDGSVAYVIKATRALPHVQTLHLRSGGLGGSVEETVRTWMPYIISLVSLVVQFLVFIILLFPYSFISL